MNLQSKATWIPGLFLFFGVMGILALHSHIKRTEWDRIQLETQITAEQVRLRLEAWIDARVAVVQHLGNKQFIDQADVENLFAEQAQHLLRLYPGIQAINYIDDYYVIRIIVPVATNRPALNQDLNDHPNLSVVKSLKRASESGKIASTSVIDLLQGGKGFATYQTLVGKNDLALGYINGVFKITRMLDNCLAEATLRDRFRYRFVEESGAIVYLHPDTDSGEEWEYAFDQSIRVVDRRWMLKLAPSPQYLATTANRADEVMAVTGLILVALLALLLRAFLLRQEALRDSQANYRLLVENQNDLVVQFDRDGRFLYVSPSYCQVFGKTEKELLGSDILPHVHEDDRANVDRSLATLLKPPYQSYHDLRVQTGKGWRWLAWSNRAVFDDDGQVVAVTAVGRDITSRRKLEEQLIQSQKMQAVGLLAGGIAHDFNNLLQAMLNNLEFVFQEIQPEGQARQDLQQVQRGVDKAIVLTHQLLAFGRQQVLLPVSLDLNVVIEEMLQMMKRLIDVSISIEFLPALDKVFIHADRGQVEQIFMNLCVNARDAMSGAGAITVKTETRELDAPFCESHPDAEPGEYGVLIVEDTGQGMTPEILERIFEPFFTTKEVGQGTGLGLASIYGIVKQHNGLMFVESEPDRGSKFTVLLPRSEKDSEPERKIPPKPSVGGSETILLAEDNEDVRNLAVRVLKKGGYQVLIASDGLEAVEVFTQHADEVDLVMLDLVMPRLGGREAGEKIRQVKPGIRILFASGYDPTSVGQEIQGLADADLLMKPFGIPDLLAKVREILDGNPVN